MTVLTTHVGSLPRSHEVVDFLFARDNGESYDQVLFYATMTAEVDRTVARQASVGIDIVSDGEPSKISYSTYVKDPHPGF